MVELSEFSLLDILRVALELLRQRAVTGPERRNHL